MNRRLQEWSKCLSVYVRSRTLRAVCVRDRTDRRVKTVYKTLVRNPSVDLIVVLRLRPGRTCAESALLLARARPMGVFELLTAAAWGRALGCPPEALNGESLRDLMRPEKPAVQDIVEALMDEKNLQPLEVTLGKGERRKRFRLHRRFDGYEKAVFVLADELVEDRVALQAACA
jgi:hypothetical protein